MFDVGVPELVLILVVALVVFGPGKLPEIGATIGKTMREFRRATQSVTDEIESVTKLESEDEMRTRLITERNKRQAAAASVPITAIESSVVPATEPAAIATGEPVVSSSVENAVSVTPEAAASAVAPASEPAAALAELQI